MAIRYLEIKTNIYLLIFIPRSSVMRRRYVQRIESIEHVTSRARTHNHLPLEKEKIAAGNAGSLWACRPPVVIMSKGSLVRKFHVKERYNGLTEFESESLKIFKGIQEPFAFRHGNFERQHPQWSSPSNSY